MSFTQHPPLRRNHGRNRVAHLQHRLPLFRRDHQQVKAHAKAPQGAPQRSRGCPAVWNIRCNNSQINVAVRPMLVRGARAKQDHAGIRVHSIDAAKHLAKEELIVV